MEQSRERILQAGVAPGSDWSAAVDGDDDSRRRRNRHRSFPASRQRYRILHELPQPLQSSGEFLVARGAGVDWHTLKPFDSEVLMTPKALIQRGPDGKPQRVNASQQPGLAAVSQVFDALFALDIDTLSQSFRLFGEKDASSTGGWRLGLVPREPAFAKVIARIVVNGADEPKLITLFEASGDRTEIELADIKTATALTDADRQRFQ
jgi:hypothetical protein